LSGLFLGLGIGLFALEFIGDSAFASVFSCGSKLRKAEEQLRIKEKSIQELNNEKILIGTRCQQLEARNYELEQNVKLLKRKIDSNQWF
jgi:hypothetical protein